MSGSAPCPQCSSTSTTARTEHLFCETCGFCWPKVAVPVWGLAADALEQMPDRILTVRTALGLSLRQVVAESGVALNSLSRCERRVGPVNADTAVKLLRWLDQREVTHG